MEDRKFLIWLHYRLTEVHAESPHADYMHKLRSIIAATPKEKITPSTLPCNNIDDLKKMLEEQP